MESDRLQGKEYAVSEAKVTWIIARDTCRQGGAELAVIETAEEDAFLRDRFTDPSSG